MASQPRREEPHRAETALERARKELFEEGISTLADVPRSRASGRRGHHRPDRRRRALGVHVRRRGDHHRVPRARRRRRAERTPATTRVARWARRGELSDDGRDRHRHRRSGRCRQEHRRPGPRRAASASSTSTPARCTGRSRSPRCAAASRSTTPTRSPSSPASSTLEVDDDGVLVDGVDATAAIRSREVTEAVSAVAANSAVRAELRRTPAGVGRRARRGSVEGRDIGSVVFPDAG